MNKFWIVLRREYLEKVQKKSFLILTLLTPIIMFGVILIPFFLAKSSKDDTEKRVVLIDQTGKYWDTIRNEKNEDGFRFLPPQKELTAYKAEHNDSLYACVVITEDLLVNPKAITIYTHKKIPYTLQNFLTNALKEQLQDEKIASYNIPDLKDIMQDSRVIIDVSTIQWAEDGKEKEDSAAVGMIIGQIFNFILFFFVLTYGSAVMANVTEEKKNRIVEIIASSVKPTTLMSAKIMAMGLVGITQIFIWSLFLLLGVLFVQGVFIGQVTMNIHELQENLMATGNFQADELHSIIAPVTSFNFTGVILAFLFYFFCSYVTYAAIFASFGAAVDSGNEDVQQYVAPVTLLMTLGFYFSFYSAENPDGHLALWGAYIPLIGPNIMMVRLPFSPPLWQVGLSMLVTFLTMLVMIWCAAKIFRVGLLMYGKKPSVRELAKWIRHS